VFRPCRVHGQAALTEFEGHVLTSEVNEKFAVTQNAKRQRLSPQAIAIQIASQHITFHCLCKVLSLNQFESNALACSCFPRFLHGVDKNHVQAQHARHRDGQKLSEA